MCENELKKLVAGTVADVSDWTEVRDPHTGEWETSNSPLVDDYDRAPKTDLEDLTNKPDYDRDGFFVDPEFFSHISFQQALDHINPSYATTGQVGVWADDMADVVSGGLDLAVKWGEVRDEVVRVAVHFERALYSLLNNKEHWDGQTKIKAFANVRKSFVAPEKISAAAGGMQTLVDAFTRTIEYVHTNIDGNRPNYLKHTASNNDDRDQHRNEFNNFARKVMGGTYSTNIGDIAANNPNFTTGPLPDLDTPQDPVYGPGPGGPGLSSGGPAGMPNFGSAQLPTGPDVSGLDDLPAGLDDLPNGPAGLGDPAQAVSDMVPSGLGNPTEAATAAPDLDRPPEGELGLGPRGVGGVPRTGSGAGGGGGGRAPLTPRLASSRPAVAPSAAGQGSAVRAAGGAGLSNGAPMMPMAPPGAGQNAGNQNGQGHQVIKALRRRKTGEQVMGKADAVVPVVGEPEKPEAARAEADQPGRMG